MILIVYLADQNVPNMRLLEFIYPFNVIFPTHSVRAIGMVRSTPWVQLRGLQTAAIVRLTSVPHPSPREDPSPGMDHCITIASTLP